MLSRLEKVAGRVVRYDESKGYGFISPDVGGDDVFLHVNELVVPESSIYPGVRVVFDLEDGDRGPRAASIRLATPDGRSSAQPTDVDDDTECDVLGRAEYTRAVTEILLKTAPSMTGEAVLRVRQELVRFAANHGWVDG